MNCSKGWGWYKHLTWKVTHNKVWDKMFHILDFKKGWYNMDNTRLPMIVRLLNYPK